MELSNPLVARTLFGFVPSQVDLLVITPLSSLFTQLHSVFHTKEHYFGFYESYLITGNNNKMIMLTRIAQGIEGQDVCWIFQNTDILFLGYAGGLSDQIELGGVYEVESAVLPEGKTLFLSKRELFSGIKVGYSPAMIGRIVDEYCAAAGRKKCDAVDMETAYCAETSLGNRNSFAAFLLVTDIPGVRNFWELTEEEKRLIKEGERNMINVAQKCMRGVIYDK